MQEIIFCSYVHVYTWYTVDQAKLSLFVYIHVYIDVYSDVCDVYSPPTTAMVHYPYV